MHELGIVVQIHKTLEDIAKENNIKEISEIVIENGEVSSVEERYLKDIFNFYKKNHDLIKNAIIKVETLEAITKCSNCLKEYRTIEYGIECPYCKSRETYLLVGNECNIKEIGVSDTIE